MVRRGSKGQTALPKSAEVQLMSSVRCEIEKQQHGSLSWKVKLQSLQDQPISRHITCAPF